jgi:hypothetical protein
MSSFDKALSVFEKADFAFTVISVAIAIVSLVGVYLNYRHTSRLHEEVAEVKALCEGRVGGGKDMTIK